MNKFIINKKKDILWFKDAPTVIFSLDYILQTATKGNMIKGFEQVGLGRQRMVLIEKNIITDTGRIGIKYVPFVEALKNIFERKPR